MLALILYWSFFICGHSARYACFLPLIKSPPFIRPTPFVVQKRWGMGEETSNLVNCFLLYKRFSWNPDIFSVFAGLSKLGNSGFKFVVFGWWCHEGVDSFPVERGANWGWGERGVRLSNGPQTIGFVKPLHWSLKLWSRHIREPSHFRQ